MIRGKIYTNTGVARRGRVVGYHQSPDPEAHNFSEARYDIASLKPHHFARGREYGHSGAQGYISKYTIGFEVEKGSIHRDAIKEYPFFKGFEEDGSCGEEAITHVNPLLPPCMWRTKVFNMMHEAERVIDDLYSATNNRCGGHVTIGVEGVDCDEFVEKLRRNVGIVYALYKKRLVNDYCNHSLNLIYDYHSSAPAHNGTHHKKNVIKKRGQIGDYAVFEFRVVSKFTSVKQMMDRYKLFFELIDFTATKPNGTFASLLKKVTPILMSMYGGDVAKVDEIKLLSKAFRRYLMSNGRMIPTCIVPFIDPHGHNRQSNNDFDWG